MLEVLASRNSSVRWDDGTYDAKPAFPNVDPIIEGESGQRLQLRRIIDALRRTLAEPASDPELVAAAQASMRARAGSVGERAESHERNKGGRARRYRAIHARRGHAAPAGRRRMADDDGRPL
jgi:hypothetical protein